MKNGTMKKIVSAFLAVAMVFGLLPAMSAPARAESSLYEPIAVTGFAYDMIINDGPVVSVENTLDIGFDDTNISYYSSDFYEYYKNAYDLSRGGLPDNGHIVSESSTYEGAVYQLKGYDENNALFLFSDGALTSYTYPYLGGLTKSITQGELTLEKPGAYETLLFLASSANGDSVFTATVNFSDGTLMKKDFTVYDWCTPNYAPGLVAIGVDTTLGRIRPSDHNTDATPVLYDCFIDLGSNKNKLVTSVSFALESTDNERAGIFALSGKRPANTPDSPVMPDAGSVIATATSFTAIWDEVAGADGYYLDVATNSDFTDMLTSYNNKDVGDVTSHEVTGLTAGATYYYRVRSYNDNGSGFSSDAVIVTTSLVQTADASENTVTAGLNPLLTGHTVMLTAAGDRQGETGVTSGDSRYIPKTWASNETGIPGGVFTKSGSEYTANYTPSAVGTYTVTATFQLQSYNGSAWSDMEEITDSKTLNLEVEAFNDAYTIDYEEETISFDDDNYRISTSSEFEPGTMLSSGDDIAPGVTYYIREMRSSGSGVPFLAPSRMATTGLSVTVGGKTDTSVTVAAIDGAEYSKDGGVTWQKSNLFTGLAPNTDFSITVRFASTAASFASSAIPPVTVRTKAGASAAEPPVITAQTANTIRINTLAGYQYSITEGDAEAASWSEAAVVAGSMIFEVLTGTTTRLDAATGYKIWARIAETGASVVSDAVSVNWYTAQTAPAAGIGYMINYGDEILTVADGYEISTTSDFSGVISRDSAITPGAVYYVRKAAVGAIPAGAALSVSAAARPAAPSLVTGVDETYKNKNDGKLIHLTVEMEYRVSGSPNWTGVTADQAVNGVTGLADGTYEIRMKAVTEGENGAFAGEIHTVTIAEGKTITISFDSKGGSTVDAVMGKACGDTIIAPADPMKNGYYFGGWFKDVSCTQNWIFETDSVSGDNTLYAKWNAVPVYTVRGAVLNGSGDPVSGASVKLLKGIIQYGATAETSAQGDFEIPYVPSGSYNLVITKDARKVILLVTVGTVDAAVGNVTLPAGVINSTLIISGSSTPNIIVDGLNQEASAQYRAGESVEITLNVEEKASDIADNGSEVATAITASGQSTGMLLDITIKKVVNGDEDTAYNETSDLIQIIIPLPEALQGKKAYKIYRYHKGSIDAITSEVNGDGEYFTVNSDKTQLTLNVMKFSTYGIAYTVNTSSSSSKSHTTKPAVAEQVSEGVWGNPYSDVRDKDWWYEAVRYVTENGLMNGTGGSTFGPKLTTTRGMIITILYRLEGKPETAGAYTFKDVSSSQYFADAVAWGAANTIIKGYDEDCYRPEKNITREQLAAILYRYAQYKGYDVTAWDDLASYMDSADVAKWALANVQWAVAKDLMSGTDQGALLPGSDCTRAQAAVMLMRFLAK